MDFNPFNVLNVSISATQDEITQARRRLARVYHPDVSQSETEEMMKRINRAYDMLVDPEKRRQFLEKSSDNNGEFKHSEPTHTSGSLAGYEFRSREFLRQFNESKANSNSIRQIKPDSKIFENVYNKYFEPEIETACREYMNVTSSRRRRLVNQKSLQDVYESVEKYFYFKDTPEDLFGNLALVDTTIQEILLSNRRSTKRVSARFEPQKTTSIVYLRSFSSKQLEELLFAIDPKKAAVYMNEKNRNTESIVGILEPMLPSVTILDFKPKSELKICFACKAKKGLFDSYNNCVACGERFCKKCTTEESSLRLPRLGFCTGRICRACRDENERWESASWLGQSSEHLRNGQLSKALFCFRAFLQLDQNSFSNESKCGRNWLDMFRNPEMRAVFLFDLLRSTNNNTINTNDESFYLTELANSLQAMADVQSRDDDKHALYFHSLVVHMIDESKTKTTSSKTRVIANLKQKLTELTVSMSTSVHKSPPTDFVRQLDELIAYSRLDDIFSLVYTNMFSMRARVAFGSYLNDESKNTKQEDSERTKIGFMFARGVYGIFYGVNPLQTLDGFRLLELAYWQSLNYSFGSSDVYVRVLTTAMLAGIPLPFEVLFRLENKLERQDYFRHLIPKRENLKPTESSIWRDISLRNKNLRPFKMYEKAIYYNERHKLMSWSRLKSALAYIDLTDACENYHELVFCFIQAAAWSLEAIDDDAETPTLALKYAFSRLLMKCVEYATFLAYMYLDTVAKSCVFTHLFGLVYYTHARFGLDQDAQLLSKLFKFYLFGSSLMPIGTNMPVMLVSEAAILSCNLRELAESFLPAMLSLAESVQPVQNYVYAYVQFEMKQHSVVSNSDNEKEESKDEVKQTAMYELLEKQKLSWLNVVQFIDYPLVERTRDGWMVSASRKLNYEKKDGTFARFNGFKINKQTYAITLLVETPTNAFVSLFKQEPLVARFDWSDVATIMCNSSEASPSFFSLDQVDERLELHPFQKFTYAPNYLKGSHFLHTLFHTDYLLKQFSMGVEVSCAPPFRVRQLDYDAGENGLLANLPAEIRRVLLSCDAREAQRHSKVSRMWIQADRLEYSIDETDDEVSFLFGEIKMSVRTHPMKPNSDGQLVDTDLDANPDSGEFKFARDFSQNYAEIAKYFPEFARLAELCKLQYLGVFLKHYASSFDSQIETNTTSERLERMSAEMLANARNNSTEYFEKVARELRREIPSHLRSSDELVNSLADKIHSAVDCSSVSRSLVQSWLRNELNEWTYAARSDLDKLVGLVSASRVLSTSEIRAKIVGMLEEKRSRFRRALESQINWLRPFYDAPRRNWPLDAKTEWVPALFKHIDGQNRFVYGGVVLCPTLDSQSSSSTSVKNLKKRSDQVNLQAFVENKKPPVPATSTRERKNEANNAIKCSSLKPPGKPPVSSPPPVASQNEEFNRGDFFSSLNRYRNRLIELFPDQKLQTKFREQLLHLVRFVNECREKYANGESFRFTPHETSAKARTSYNNQLDELRKKWEDFYGIKWPRDENGRYYEAHHIVPLTYGGPNEIWNIIPVRFEEHRGKGVGLHSTHLVDLNPVMRELCNQAMPEYRGATGKKK